jgi:hypothetical protein
MVRHTVLNTPPVRNALLRAHVSQPADMRTPSISAALWDIPLLALTDVRPSLGVIRKNSVNEMWSSRTEEHF